MRPAGLGRLEVQLVYTHTHTHAHTHLKTAKVSIEGWPANQTVTHPAHGHHAGTEQKEAGLYVLASNNIDMITLSGEARAPQYKAHLMCVFLK